jgi:hypothetical protein
MDDERLSRLRDWVEPAHPAIIRLHDDLVAILKRVRDEYQLLIDETFDKASRRIGFVVATALPLTMEIADKGKLKNVGLVGEHLKGTLFEEGFAPVLKSMARAEPMAVAGAGVYRFPVLWLDALRLRLRTDWMEPAHFRDPGSWRWQETSALASLIGYHWMEPAHIGPEVMEPAHIGPGVMEPAHWRDLDPGLWQAGPHPEPWRERVLVSALDAVYPELRLVERLGAYRAQGRRIVGPEVKEPAHFRDMLRFSPEVLAELAAVLRKHGY